MKRICVFCGSSAGSRPEYRAAAEEIATELVRRNIGLVYGGGKIGCRPVAKLWRSSGVRCMSRNGWIGRRGERDAQGGVISLRVARLIPTPRGDASLGSRSE